MHHNDPLLQILILLTASVCVVAGVRKLKLPAILGYLAVGMLLGPHAFALAADNETTRLLADFGVVFLVFTLGLEFSLPRLVAMRGEVLGVGGAQVLITTGIVAAGAVMLFDVAPAVAVVIGGAVAMSSTAIIIAQLTEQSENNRTHGRLAVAICLFQDLSFPLFLALVSALSSGRAPDAAHIVSAIGTAALALLLVLAAGGRWLLRPLFLVIASVRSAELFSLAVLLAVLASAWATHAVGLSLALGAFLAGMMLAETEFRHQIEATIRSYREVLLGLFFITVGMLLDVGLLLRHFPMVAAILVGMLLLKAAVVTAVAKPATKSWFKSLRTGVVVGQGGEFGFALLTLLLRRELLDPAVVQPLLAAIVLSMVLSPILIRHNRRITRLLGESGPALAKPCAPTRRTSTRSSGKVSRLTLTINDQKALAAGVWFAFGSDMNNEHGKQRTCLTEMERVKFVMKGGEVVLARQSDPHVSPSSDARRSGPSSRLSWRIAWSTISQKLLEECRARSIGTSWHRRRLSAYGRFSRAPCRRPPPRLPPPAPRRTARQPARRSR